MKTIAFALAVISALTLAVPAWANKDQNCNPGQVWDQAQGKCIAAGNSTDSTM